MDLGDSDAGSPRPTGLPGLPLAGLGESASMQVELVNGEVVLKWEAAGILAAPPAASSDLPFTLPLRPAETLPSPALSSLSTLPPSLPPKPSTAATLPHQARAPFALPARPSNGYPATSSYHNSDNKPTFSPVKREVTSPPSRHLSLKAESPFSPPPADDVKPLNSPGSSRAKREASTSSLPSPNPIASTSTSASASDAEDDSASGSTSEDDSSRARSKSPKKLSKASRNVSPRKDKGKRVKKEEPEAQLIGHLPLANDEVSLHL